MYIKKGTNRICIITKIYTFKIPYFYRYRNFLNGLLANLQEKDFNKLNDIRLAKIYLSLPGGILNVMKTAKELNYFNYDELYNFCNDKRYNYNIPVEIKKDSFGIIDGDLVAIDYGT